VALYLLDTTVLIDLSKGIVPVRPRLDALVDAGHDLGICALNVAEFLTGVPPSRRAEWEAWLASFQFWHVTWEAAVLAGVYRQTFRSQGRAIGIVDALLAALAVTLDATIVTDNAKDFPMVGLRIVSVRG